MAEDHHIDLEQYTPNRYAHKPSIHLEQSSWQAPDSISLDVGHQLNVQELSSRHRPEMRSTTGSIHAASDSGMGCSHIPTAYSIRDQNLDEGTDAREPGTSMSASVAHITGPIRALPVPEGLSTSAASGRSLKAMTCSCSDGDSSGKSSYPRGSGTIGDAFDEPPAGPAAIHRAPSRHPIDRDALIVARSTRLLIEDMRTHASPSTVNQGHFEGILRTGPSVATARLLPLLPGVAPAPIPNSSVEPALFPSSSLA